MSFQSYLAFKWQSQANFQTFMHLFEYHFFQLRSFKFSIMFRILNSIQFKNLNSIEMYAMLFNISISMELNFHKINSFLSLIDCH
jgi:hypothetical protein